MFKYIFEFIGDTARKRLKLINLGS